MSRERPGDDRQRDLEPREAAERYLADKQREFTANTLRSYRTRLQEFLAWCDDQDDVDVMRDLDGWHIDEYERHLETQGHAPSTVKGKINAVKQLAKYAAKIEVVDWTLPLRITLPRVRPEDQTSDDLLEKDAAASLLEYYRDSTRHQGTIYHVILELMWHVGGRRSCFRALDLNDWHPDQRKLEFRHRPPTRLKNGVEHERNVAVAQPVADALNLWIERERPRKRDSEGRTPLLTTTHGRASGSTIQCWAYQATQPCLHQRCPHNNRRETCQWTERSKASQCPSSRGPHAIRTGSITWQLNNGLTYVEVAERVASSPETIRRYYDKPDYDEQMQRRLPDTEDLDVLTSPF